jgi:hypothetical protein
LNQSIDRWKCVVIDDDDKYDDALRVCEALDDDRIKYVKNSHNLGIGRNINKAFSILPFPESTHACVLEDDNYFLSRCLEDNLSKMRSTGTDIVMRNQYVERALDGDGSGELTNRTMYEGQYLEGVVSNLELWSVLFYSVGLINSGVFWRLNRGISFDVENVSGDPIFQERFRTLCIDRDVYLAMDPQGVWCDNGVWTNRKTLNNSFQFYASLIKSACAERSLYKSVYAVLEQKNCEELIWNNRFRPFDDNCERVFRRCGINLLVKGNMHPRAIFSIWLKRKMSCICGAIIADRVRYSFDGNRFIVLG